MFNIDLESDLSKGSRLILNVKRMDNKITVFVNGCVVFNQYYDENPSLNIIEDLTHYLIPGEANSIAIVCINYGGPYHFDYSLRLGHTLLSDVNINGHGMGLRAARGCYLGKLK